MVNTLVVGPAIGAGRPASGARLSGLPMPARGIILLLLLGTASLVGCSRAHDGTVLYANPINRMLGTEDHPDSPVPVAFPAAPAPPVREARAAPPPRRSNLRLWDVRPVRLPPVSASTAASLLSCHDETQPGGRVKVVCE